MSAGRIKIYRRRYATESGRKEEMEPERHHEAWCEIGSLYGQELYKALEIRLENTIVCADIGLAGYPDSCAGMDCGDGAAECGGHDAEPMGKRDAPAGRVHRKHAGSSHFLGDISVGGAKNRAVRTENYGTIAMNAVESASPVFADMGSGKIGADGRCYLMFDSIFRETIEGMHAYHVFVSGTSGKGCRCVSKEKDYAVIEGEAGEEFDWIIYGRQKGYAMTRMEALNIPDAAMLDNEDLLYNEYGGEDLETLAMNYLDEYEKEMVLL